MGDPNLGKTPKESEKKGGKKKGGKKKEAPQSAYAVIERDYQRWRARNYRQTKIVSLNLRLTNKEAAQTLDMLQDLGLLPSGEKKKTRARVTRAMFEGLKMAWETNVATEDKWPRREKWAQEDEAQARQRFEDWGIVY